MNLGTRSWWEGGDSSGKEMIEGFLEILNEDKIAVL